MYIYVWYVCNNYKINLGGMNLKVSNKTIILSVLASICFFIAYFIHKETINLVLGIVWICISIEEWIKIKNRK